MKDDEKDKKTGTEPSGHPKEEPKKLDRGEFLKTVGVGVAAAGLGLVTGKSSARAATEPDSTRSGIQKLMRSLLENQSRAEDFLNNPQAVAEEFGVRLTADDANKIKDVFTRLARKMGPLARMHGDTHTEAGHTDSPDSIKRGGVNKKPPTEGGTLKPPTEGGTLKPPTEGVAPKPPTGGRQRR